MPSLSKRIVIISASIVVFLLYFLHNGPVWANEAVGERFEILIEKLPQPFETPSAANRPLIVERPVDAALQVPTGFEVNAFAEELDKPRWMEIAENGDVFVTEEDSNSVVVLRDTNNDGVADVQSIFLSDLNRPHGLAFYGEYLYIAETTQVRRVRYEIGVLEASGPLETVTTAGSLGDGSGHWTRNIVFAPDGKHFFVTVGSRSNRDVDAPPRATVQRFAADGGDQTTFASGLRNPVGIGFYPGSDDLYVVVNERDGLGDELVPDYLTRIDEGGFYGWPFFYLGHHVDPKYEGHVPSTLERTLEADLLFKAHSSPLGLVFYDADQFPPEYVGDAFVAFHGSWNASSPTGYKIVRLPFENGRPAKWYENFAVGFHVAENSWLDDLINGKDLRAIARWVKYWFVDDKRARVWGRPVGLAVGKDGSLLVADDAGGTIWRISYKR